MDWLPGLAEGLRGTAFAAWASGAAYPVANVIHLLGLVMLVGGIGVVDLRLAGALPSLPARALSRALTPIALAGLAMMLPSGFILFAADATTLAVSEVFRWKLMLIALALTHAIAFHWLWGDRLADWDARAPPLARAMAVGSLALWLVIGTLGRMIAYS